MNILKRITDLTRQIVSLFTKENISKDTSIINFFNVQHITSIPKRNEFLEHENEIDYHISEYTNILKSKKIVFSNDLINPEDILKLNNINLHLLRELFDTDIIDRDFDYNVNSFYSRNLLKIKLHSLKMKMYLEDINKLKLDVNLRLVALGEILKNNILLSLKRRTSLLNAINDLQGMLVVIDSQEHSAKLESETCLDKIDGELLIRIKLHYKNVEDLKEEEYPQKEYLEKRLKEVKQEAQRVLSKETMAELESKESDNFSTILLYELFLEKYVYLNETQVAKLKAEAREKRTRVDNLTASKVEEYKRETFPKQFSRAEKNQIEELIWQVIEIQYTYEIFQKYGYKDNEDFADELYRLLFDLGSCDAINLQAILCTSYKDNKEKCDATYRTIVREKLSRVMNDEFGYLENEFGDLAPKVKKILERRITKLLQDSLFFQYVYQEDLSTLLFIERGISVEKSLQKLIDYHYAEVLVYHELNLNKMGLCIKIDDSRPLCMIPFTEIVYKRYILRENSIYNKLLYLLTKKYAKQGIYKFPEGLLEINSNVIEADSKILKLIQNKTVVFPSTLKTIKDGVLPASVTGIVLNENLEEIGDHALDNLDLKEVAIPSSVNTISETAFNFEEIETLEFRDYTNSKIFKNRKSLCALIEKFLTKPSLNDTDEMVPPETLDIPSISDKLLNVYFVETTSYDNRESVESIRITKTDFFKQFQINNSNIPEIASHVVSSIKEYIKEDKQAKQKTKTLNRGKL